MNNSYKEAMQYPRNDVVDQADDRLNAVCFDVQNLLQETAAELKQLCVDTDPDFVKIGRHLRIVANETKDLITAVQQPVEMINSSKEDTSLLHLTSEMVRDIQSRLSDDRLKIERNLAQIRELINKLSDSRRINDTIDVISSSFRAVRINIRIQCSVQLLSEDIFKDVTDDIDSLSKTLIHITKQLKKDLEATLKNLIRLERTVSDNLLRIDRISQQADRTISKAYDDISHIVQGTETIMQQANTRSQVIAEKIDDVVVAIQFHDSLSQRSDHVIQVFEDICSMCGSVHDEINSEKLGTAYHILELQHRQLVHIYNEVSSVYDRIKESFTSIGGEVKVLNSIQLDSQFQAAGPQQFLSTLYASLQKALIDLCDLLSQGEDMLDQINITAMETRVVAERLMKVMVEINDMRDETRLQAVNTIIMASNLGKKGRTIQVLAKEISFLSKQTNVLVDDIDTMQLSVTENVGKLCKSFEQSLEVANKKILEQQVLLIGNSYREIEDSMTTVSRLIESSSGHIDSVESDLYFLQDLKGRLSEVVRHIEQVRESLAPWQDDAMRNSQEMDQLVQRYTMEQERLIHMFNGVEADEIEKNEEDVFF